MSGKMSSQERSGPFELLGLGWHISTERIWMMLDVGLIQRGRLTHGTCTGKGHV